MKKGHEGLTEVFSGALFEVQVIQGLLESNGVATIVDDDTLSAVTSPYLTAGGEVHLLVNSEQADLARQIIQEARAHS